jgi:type II secretory pathway pseudopilin PulG
VGPRSVYLKHWCEYADLYSVPTSVDDNSAAVELPPAPPRPERSSMAGITMMEMLVGMLLLAILIAVAFRPIVNAMSGSSKSQTLAAATEAVQNAMDLAREDIRRMAAPDRNPRKLRDEAEYRRALTTDLPVYSADPADPEVALDVADIRRAEDNRLTFLADVIAPSQGQVAENGAECVDYTVTTTPKYSVVRTISAVSPDPASAIVDTDCGRDRWYQVRQDVLIKPYTPIPGRTPTQAFAYDVTCNGCDLPTAGAGAEIVPAGWVSSCSSFAADTVRGVPMNWIVSIQMSFGAAVTRGGEVSEYHTTTAAAIPSRSVIAYRRALGCA